MKSSVFHPGEPGHISFVLAANQKPLEQERAATMASLASCQLWTCGPDPASEALEACAVSRLAGSGCTGYNRNVSPFSTPLNV